MSTEQVEFLEEYDRWKAERRIAFNDLTPEAFLVDRAKEQALEKLIKISDLMDQFYSADWEETDDAYERLSTKLHDGIQDVLNS